jgi:uncharacterized membrane protein
MFLSNLSIVISHYVHIPLFLLCSVLTPFHTQTQTEKEEDNNSGRREKEEDATQKKNTRKEEELHGLVIFSVIISLYCKICGFFFFIVFTFFLILL